MIREGLIKPGIRPADKSVPGRAGPSIQRLRRRPEGCSPLRPFLWRVAVPCDRLERAAVTEHCPPRKRPLEGCGPSQPFLWRVAAGPTSVGARPSLKNGSDEALPSRPRSGLTSPGRRRRPARPPGCCGSKCGRPKARDMSSTGRSRPWPARAPCSLPEPPRPRGARRRRAWR